MPIINTRKRKPSNGSALDQLAAISSHELASRALNAPATRYAYAAGRPGDENDDGDSSSDGETHRRTRRRVNGSDDDADYDRLAADIEYMKVKLRRAEQALAMRQGSSSHYGAQSWSSTHTLSEILKLQMTLETALGKSTDTAMYQPLELARANPHENFDCAPMMLDAIRRDVVRIYAFLTEQRADLTPLGQHIGPALEGLWQQASLHTAAELSAKLAFWKHHAQDLKERLRVALGAITTRVTGHTASDSDSVTTAPAETSPPSPAVEAALQSALDFVSTFYLMDMAGGAGSGSDPIKEKAIHATTAAIIDGVRQLDAKRVEARPAIDLPPPVAFTPMHHPPAYHSSDIQAADRGAYEPEPSPPSTSRSTATNFFTADDDGDDPSEEDEPLPMQSPTFATATAALAATASRSSAVSQHQNPPPAIGASSSNQKKLGLPLAARRRLAAVLDSQLGQGNGSVQASHEKAASKTVGIRKIDFLSFDQLNALPTTSLSTPSTFARASKDSSAATNSPSTANGCAKCNRNDSQHSLLLCDNDCGREFHTFCLTPPLATIPDGDWFCPACRSAEHLLPDQRVYLCSASLCDKITATKFCTLHRCHQDKCLNRSRSNGMCRRHEANRVGKPATVVPATPAKPKAVPASASSSPAPAKDKGTGTPAAKPKLSDEQIMSNMKEMGIWLPANLLSKKAAKSVAAKAKKLQQPRRS